MRQFTGINENGINIKNLRSKVEELFASGNEENIKLAALICEEHKITYYGYWKTVFIPVKQISIRTGQVRTTGMLEHKRVFEYSTKNKWGAGKYELKKYQHGRY